MVSRVIRPDSALASALESVLLVASEPISVRTLTRLLDIDGKTLDRVVDYLIADQAGRGIRLQNHENRLQLVTAPENAEVVREYLRLPRQPRISRASLETLAIIAYRQPVTRAEIEDIRGVNVDRVVANLVARGWLEERGRRDTPGRPVEYGTTSDFLEVFGLLSLEDLPPPDPDLESNATSLPALGMHAEGSAE